PYKNTSQRVNKPIHQPVGQRDIHIDHVAIRATQYEFYFPIAIWHVDATKNLLNALSRLARGATVFKGATGVWREEKKREKKDRKPAKVVEEDVYVYRIIVDQERFNPDNNRPSIHTLVANYMAEL